MTPARKPAMTRRPACFGVDIGGLPIELTQQGRDRFTVIYWKQIKNNLTYAEAAAELGACIMHAAACEGKLDNGEAS